MKPCCLECQKGLHEALLILRHSVVKMVSKVFNWLTTIFYFYLTYRGISLIFLECDEHKYKSIIYQYGLENKHKYLSIWVSFLQTLYFVIVSFSDIVNCLPSVFVCPRWSQYSTNARHYLLTSLVLPLTLYIFTVFWTFYLYDREVIYPELFDRFIPPWLNHAMHSLPVPILLVHLILGPNHNPSRTSALVGLSLLFVVYGVVFGASVLKGNWVYLLFNNLNPSQRMFLLTISYPLTIVFLTISRGLNSFVKRTKEKYAVKEKGSQ
ncbi:androgen-dependent TFPI-regulating protein-like [Macrosteles quadrilineatus]|uniref:androgen-dependent TFPI-regulating protein-like n=1 Tax=Macrosteles quadrilineatus TaxID=74068 RepID=UPI0023E1F6C2|nr:androgen-dependent TFPI-regulating protein-like [Macrosteles quadrilineatus]